MTDFFATSAIKRKLHLLSFGLIYIPLNKKVLEEEVEGRPSLKLVLLPAFGVNVQTVISYTVRASKMAYL